MTAALSDRSPSPCNSHGASMHGKWLIATGFVLSVALSVSRGAGPVPPGEAAGKMTLPEGFNATLFCGEPDVVQPIAFTFDDRGRVWVAECLSYPNWQADPKGGKARI